MTAVTARMVRSPLIEECPAHLECVLDDVKRYRDEVLIFGRVVAASIDEGYADVPIAEQYERLAPVFFLEAGTYAHLGPAQRISD